MALRTLVGIAVLVFAALLAQAAPNDLASPSPPAAEDTRKAAEPEADKPSEKQNEAPKKRSPKRHAPPVFEFEEDEEELAIA